MKHVLEDVALTARLELAQAECAAMRDVMQAVRSRHSVPYKHRSDSTCALLDAALALPSLGQAYAARLAAAEAVVARAQDRDFVWTCPHVDCEDSDACVDGILGAILQPPTIATAREADMNGEIDSEVEVEMNVVVNLVRAEIDDLLCLEAGLTEWEVQFVWAVDRRLDDGPLPLADGQVAKIHEIWDRRCG